jgi:hypothetical protein
LNVHKFNEIRQIEINRVEPLVRGPSPFENKIIISMLKYKSPVSDQIPAELIQAEGEALECEIHKLINSIWNKEELPDQWNESIIVPVHKKCDKTDCNNYQGMSQLSTSYIDKIIGDDQCGLRRNRSATYQIFCICQMLEKKWDYNGTVHQLFTEFKKAYDPVRREVL